MSGHPRCRHPIVFRFLGLRTRGSSCEGVDPPVLSTFSAVHRRSRSNVVSRDLGPPILRPNSEQSAVTWTDDDTEELTSFERSGSRSSSNGPAFLRSYRYSEAVPVAVSPIPAPWTGEMSVRGRTLTTEGPVPTARIRSSLLYQSGRRLSPVVRTSDCYVRVTSIRKDSFPSVISLLTILAEGVKSPWTLHDDVRSGNHSTRRETG